MLFCLLIWPALLLPVTTECGGRNIDGLHTDFNPMVYTILNDQDIQMYYSRKIQDPKWKYWIATAGYNPCMHILLVCQSSNYFVPLALRQITIDDILAFRGSQRKEGG